jgi:FERM, RhoGEF and pleckstrin domain protein 2
LQCWLDKEKSILRQIMAAQSDARFFFIVKFYTPNPAELEEEYTRYMFALQIRRDLARGEFVCNENTAAMLVSFVVSLFVTH